MTRRFISAAVSILLLAGFAGCATDLGRGMIKELKENKEGIRQELGELWDAFLEEANEWAESFAAHSVTADRDLAGRRERGGDNYVGSYQAGYSGFNGKQYIFGAPRSSGRMEATCARSTPSRSCPARHGYTI